MPFCDFQSHFNDDVGSNKQPKQKGQEKHRYHHHHYHNHRHQKLLTTPLEDFIMLRCYTIQKSM